jgi:hypothetical protein
VNQAATPASLRGCRWCALGERIEVKNIRKTFGLAAIAGALAVAPIALGAGTANADSGVNWDAVAACESGGNQSANMWQKVAPVRSLSSVSTAGKPEFACASSQNDRDSRHGETL